MKLPRAAHDGLAALGAVLLAVAGCSHGTAPVADPPTGEEPAAAADAVTLTPQEIEKAGITTQAAQAATHAAEATGYAVVTPRESIAQSVADLATAAAVQRQSRAALARAHRLAGTPGALPVEAQESAERQAAADQAALLLAQRRMSAAFGSQAPWRDNYNSAQLASLASGTTRLARVTFPLGALTTATPAHLDFVHLGEEAGTRSAASQTVWAAPADPTLPGRSLFAILKGADAAEGERLVAHAPVGAAQSGVIVPFAAAVISGGKYWCYVESRPGVFVRTEIDTRAATPAGYFVTERIAAGTKLVVTSAGELLARETNPAAGAAD